MKTLLLFIALLPLFAHSQVTVQATPTASDTVTLKPKFGAVALAISKDTAMCYLSAVAKVDIRSVGQIAYKWYKVSGPACTILKPDSIGTKVARMPVGVYRFGFIVTDKRISKSDTAYRNVTIKR